ncbi:DUF2214 domain-containing protein [Roseococcus sp. SYP-B2431]|uniref:DUF6644 family protein n=1 Tax=Roseococcus sp. SYP-B2431 TaxID=2496640 RepID=UPI00103DA433|nr:DUF6644 family protein [Roseococcus sp. SYP-B2431]TCH98363.1 DUF2214 domain-containing protein [Roseococcus sp. SYP-B2431]
MLDAIAAWPLAAALRGSAVIYVLINAMHIAAVGLLLGSIVTLDLRLLGLFRSYPIAHLAPPLVRVATAGLLVAAITGLLLFSTRPATYAANPAFLAKLALIVVGLLNVAFLRLRPRWMEDRDGQRAAVSVRAAAAVSLIVWLGAVLAGRWIGFLQ